MTAAHRQSGLAFPGIRINLAAPAADGATNLGWVEK